MCVGALSGCSSEETSGEDLQPEVTYIDDIQRNDLSNERAVDWQRYEVVDETNIRVFFSAGSKSCYGTRALVEETFETIEIAVLEGSFPGAPDVCTLIAREASILAETSQPVADREVIQLADPELNP